MLHHQKKAPRPSLSERVAAFLDIPADMPEGIRLDLRGRRTLTVHGCRRILDFTPTVVILSLGEDALEITGDALICTAYLAGAVGIEGRVDGICFLTGRGAAKAGELTGARAVASGETEEAGDDRKTGGRA